MCDVRGAFVNCSTAERDLIDGRKLDNNMLIYNTTDSEYQTYTGGTRDGSGFLLGGSWETASLGGGSDYVAVNSDGLPATATGTDAIAIGENA